MRNLVAFGLASILFPALCWAEGSPEIPASRSGGSAMTITVVASKPAPTQVAVDAKLDSETRAMPHFSKITKQADKTKSAATKSIPVSHSGGSAQLTTHSFDR